MRRGFVLVTDAASEPISKADIKLAAKIDTSADDDFLDRLITAVRREVEDWTGRALITQTRKLVLDGFVRNYIELPGAPLQSVTSIVTIDDDGNETTFEASNYIVDTVIEPGRVALKTSSLWPTDFRPYAGVEITYVCGYGDDATDVPAPLRHAMIERAAVRYRYREGQIPQAALDMTYNTIQGYYVFGGDFLV